MENECYNSSVLSFAISEITKSNGCHNVTFKQPNDIESDVVRYSYIAILIFGILGNILVIISIIKQRNLLKNNYYFLVSQLAISDLLLLTLIISLVGLYKISVQKPLQDNYAMERCLVLNTEHVFYFAGVGMMLIISVLRYRATVHPLKPAIRRKKLKVVCTLVFIFSVVAGYGPVPLLCSSGSQIQNIIVGYYFTMYQLLPVVFMAVVYYKIYRTLVKQSKLMKRVCSTLARRDASSSYRIVRYIRNRRTFLVCLGTVLVYVVGNIPGTVNAILYRIDHSLFDKYYWIRDLTRILMVAGSNSFNPLVYGILDKKLFLFWKLCSKRKRKRQRSRPVANFKNETSL